MVGLAAANIFDALATLNAVSFGVEEANPIMRALIDFDPAVFAVTKIVAGSILIAFCCTYAPRWVLALVVAAYIGVLTIHVWGWWHL